MPNILKGLEYQPPHGAAGNEQQVREVLEDLKRNYQKLELRFSICHTSGEPVKDLYEFLNIAAVGEGVVDLKTKPDCADFLPFADTIRYNVSVAGVLGFYQEHLRKGCFSCGYHQKKPAKMQGYCEKHQPGNKCPKHNPIVKGVKKKPAKKLAEIIEEIS
jgi:hypothetical protein